MEIVFLTRAEKANLNAAGTDGNITSLKKTTEIDNTQRVFISGASVKYALKQYLQEIGWTLSPLKPRTEQAQVTTECNPKKYIDDDLFGYMNTESEVKRVAPVKTNGMISLFPYSNDLNRGVRFDPQGTEHSLYDIEIVTTVFRSNWAVEIDRIGRSSAKHEGDAFDLPSEEKEKRLKALLEGIFNFWSRVKQTNYLTGLTPQILTIVLRDDKTITVGDKLYINSNYELDINALNEVLSYHMSRIKEAYVGYLSSFIRNAKDVKVLSNDKVKVMPLPDLKNLILGNDFRFFT